MPTQAKNEEHKSKFIALFITEIVREIMLLFM